MSLLFSPFTLPSPAGGLTLPNRIVVAPMCQYSALDGCATDWHLTHWANLLNSGAALVTLEATAVEADGRISPGRLGLITEPAQAEQVLRQGDADLVALARAFLYNPRWGWQAAAELGGTVAAMPAYCRSLPRPAQAIFGNVRIGMR